jgi:hypothetical protein
LGEALGHDADQRSRVANVGTHKLTTKEVAPGKGHLKGDGINGGKAKAALMTSDN